MQSRAAELARRLALEAQAVCRHYLSNGRCAGRYWLVSDVANTPGRSLFVRLKGPGTVGKWTDAATGEHGDLLDLIARNRGLDRLGDVLDEARSFLGLPRSVLISDRSMREPQVPPGSPESAERLFAISQPIAGTIAETYLRNRGITALHGTGSLRFHPRYYRPDEHSLTEIWPAMIAAVTDLGAKMVSTWCPP